MPVDGVADAISPSNQGGELHKPSDKLKELCAPLHPLEFGLVYLLTHKGIGDKGSVSCGPADPSQFKEQLRALKLVEHAAALLPPIVKRLRAAVREELGKDYCDNLNKHAGSFTQGNEAMPDAMNLSILMVCHGLGKALDMRGYMKRMGGNMAWPGDWCAGGGLDTVRDLEPDHKSIVQFKKAITDVGGSDTNADEFLANLKWMMADEGDDKKKPQGGGMKAKKKPGCVGKVIGKIFPVMPYVMWW